MKILVINGPNLNLLGAREKKHYGTVTLDKINKSLELIAKKHGANLVFFQSNHEGDLVDFIQKNREKSDGILVNAGALTHYGYSLRDALTDSKLPVVEVHLSNIYTREAFRKTDVLSDIVIGGVFGFKNESYVLGLEALISHIDRLNK
jgi:3-dehydroquinate dehydratase-2